MEEMRETIRKTMKVIAQAEKGLSDIMDGPAWLVCGEIDKEDALLLIKRLHRLALIAQSAAANCYLGLDSIEEHEKAAALTLIEP